MKHFAISFLALAMLLAPGVLSAQCTADFDFNGAVFGVSPDPTLGATFADGLVDQPYEDVLHVILPSNTGDIPGAPVSFPLDSIVLEDLSLVGEMGEVIALSEIGLVMTPYNDGDSGNPYAFLGGNQYCASITGTPDSAGVFTGLINTTAWVTVPILGANSIPFPFEGFTLTIISPAIPGCTDASACNYDMDATLDDGSCTYVVPGQNCDGSCINDVDMDGVCDELQGCTDMAACNYDPAVTNDDGSCTYAADYYDCAGACLNDADDDGVCDELEVGGCTDMDACNYDEAATDDDGSCTFAEAYYDCDGNCLNDADGDGVCDELEVAGCTDMTACNYDEAATDDDGSCTFAEAYYDCDGNCLNDADGDGVCDELEMAGCTSPYACNWDEMATDDDGSCLYVGDACDDGDDSTVDDTIQDDCSCGGTPVGVEELALASLEVFPNPVSSTLFLGLSDASVLQGAEVTLRNLAGSEVQRLVWTGRTTMNVSSLSEGLYLLTVATDQGVATRRVTVTH